MAARGSSLSSDNASISFQERSSASNEESSEDKRVGDQRRTTEVERPSLTRQLSNSQNEKGEAIIKDEEMVGKTVGTSENLEVDEMNGEWVECSCCYREFQCENVVQCVDGHQFCFECIEKQVNEILYGGVKAHGSLSCFAADEDCKESIPLSEISKAIPNDVVERYEYRQAQDALDEAKIENLIYCPFCSIPYEIDNCAQVLDCPSPKCLKSSCIQCKGLSHLPLRCEEVDEKSAETALRREVEERMAKAVIRECNVCKSSIMKSGGCNTMKCGCGNKMCYVCRQTISHFHFCVRGPRIGELGKPCPQCNKCYIYDSEIEANEALAAREEAFKELAAINPELHALKIGPPLEWVTPQPSTEGQTNRTQPIRKRECIIPEECKSPLARVEAKKEDNKDLASRLEMIRMNRRLIDLEIGRPLNRREFNVHGDQPANRSNELKPPQEFNVHGYQLANMLVPPPLPVPQLFDHGDQLANRPLPRSSPPPPELLEHGRQISNDGAAARLPPKSS